MDKVTVNNQIVSMRKFVKQAKIHVINKFTKQIKFLENRKGSEEQVAKSKRKHQRFLDELNILKKIQPDSVSKLVLSKAKDWKAILAQKNVPLEDRCLAMLANHPPVQESFEKFCSDNSKLVSEIPKLLKEMEEKAKTSRRRKINQEFKGKNDNNPNKLPIGNKNSLKSQESLSDSSDLKNHIKKQNFKFKKVVKRKNSSDNEVHNFDPSDNMSSPPPKKLLIANEAKSDKSDDSISDASDTLVIQPNNKKEEMQAKDQTKNDQSNEIDSDDSLSDSSDNQNCQSNEKLPIQELKSDHPYKNSKEHETTTANNQTNLIKKKVLPKKDAMNSGCSKKTMESSEEESSEKLQGIQSKFLEISRSKAKVQNSPRNKCSPVVHQLNANVETESDDETSADANKKLGNNANITQNNGNANTNPSFHTKPAVKNKIKAITMLNLSELQDTDEIPIEKSDSDTENETGEDSSKQKKDPFFLRDGEPVSESDEDESAEKETGRKNDFPPFNKKPYGNFNRRERRDPSFQKRFDKHSANGRNVNFKEKGYMKSKEMSFKDNKQNFKRTFDDKSQYKQNKFQLPPKDKFSNRNGTNNFARNPKEKSFSQNQKKFAKGNSYPPKPLPSNPPQSVKPDDKPLHPSWEAKKKLKEAANMKFQGKITYFKD